MRRSACRSPLARTADGIVGGVRQSDPLDRARAICQAFPEVTERFSRGAPTWFVRGKSAAELCEDAYRVVAPKRLVAQLDAA
jgi:hypothetical protein